MPQGSLVAAFWYLRSFSMTSQPQFIRCVATYICISLSCEDLSIHDHTSLSVRVLVVRQSFSASTDFDPVSSQYMHISTETPMVIHEIGIAHAARSTSMIATSTRCSISRNAPRLIPRCLPILQRRLKLSRNRLYISVMLCHLPSPELPVVEDEALYLVMLCPVNCPFGSYTAP
jgi:hypothetical protein